MYQYLISLIPQNQIKESLKILKTDTTWFSGDISRSLKLWDIIIKHSQTDEKEELFFILTNYKTDLITKKKAEITEIVQNMISNHNYHHLLILLLIFNKEFCEIVNEQNQQISLSYYLLSNLKSQEKKQLLLEKEKLKPEKLSKYNIMEWDVYKIKNFLELAKSL